ncbi:MAG: hypothetical protein JW840_11075 [Candidatus Thermoplasmatota archaeon]|nr:hypothetical protein [Candidatus Thermoplasmatota archaeon]
MKKLLSCILIGILVLSGLGAAVPATHQNLSLSEHTETATAFYDDELDQSMTGYDGTLPIGHVFLGTYLNLSVAQSFIPQRELLTRIQFLMAVNSSATQPCVVAIRDNLTEDDLTAISLEPSEFPVVNATPTQEQLAWIDFDFQDLWVIPGQTYYIVVYTTNITGNFYWIAGNGSNIYLNGTVLLSVDDGNTWTEFTDADGCFKTYGLRETFLEITMTPGLFKTKFTIKNIGNYTAWDILLNFTISGGIILLGKHFNGNISELAPGEEAILSSGLILGLGKTTLSITVSAANVKEMSVERDALILLFFIKIL